MRHDGMNRPIDFVVRGEVLDLGVDRRRRALGDPGGEDQAGLGRRAFRENDGNNQRSSKRSG